MRQIECNGLLFKEISPGLCWQHRDELLKVDIENCGLNDEDPEWCWSVTVDSGRGVLHFGDERVRLGDAMQVSAEFVAKDLRAALEKQARFYRERYQETVYAMNALDEYRKGKS